ncbi:MAG: HRDC domain-containing protein [Planctomycetota bacterium]
MDLAALPAPTLVADRDGLERLLDRLDAATEVAVDTEADSFFSYRDKVCLVQVSALGQDYLVDPLCGLDLAPLGRLFADPARTKIFHDAEYDILILKRDYGFQFRNLFDTRVAAAVLGSQAPGLASVLDERFGVTLDKSMQRSNWAQRPLSDKQVAYARLDTRFLVELMHSQREELAARGRARIVDAECRRLEGLAAVAHAFDPDDYVRLKGARELDPRQRRALRELFVERERAAHAADVPPFRILSNDALLELARLRPSNEKGLLRVPGITSKVVARIGERLLETLDRAEGERPIERLPQPPRRNNSGPDLDELQVELYERLKRVRREVSDDLSIEASYLMTRALMTTIAQQRPTTLDALEALGGVEDWQLELLGKPVVAAVRAFEADVAAGRVPAKRPRRRPRG